MIRSAILIVALFQTIYAGYTYERPNPEDDYLIVRDRDTGYKTIVAPWISSSDRTQLTDDFEVPAQAPPHGRDGFIKVTNQWKRVTVGLPEKISLPLEKVLTSPKLQKKLAGDLELYNLVFFNMNMYDENEYPNYKGESDYEIEGRKVKRYYVFLGKKVESFQAKAKIKGEKGKNLDCTVVGIARHKNATTQEINMNYMYFDFDYSVTTEPFANVKMNHFDMFPHSKRANFAIYLDPECAGLHQKELEKFSYETERSVHLQSAIRSYIKEYVRRYVHKHMITPYRKQIEKA